MAEVDPKAARRFAVEVVRKLRAAGHQALWAGGCVRDQLLGRQPLDYDVATSARPEEIRRLFGRRRTLAIGASFGVITVLGRRRAGSIEVATFRQDAQYSDGRHPDSVTFSSAEEDAQRRDFTINGLFYDPLDDRVIDYVGGQQDLERQVIRAIGDPHQRIAEDKLRMLRAVRFAAAFEFTIDPGTRAAIRQHAGEITQVSAERIAAELRRTLVHPHRATAVRLLRETGLLAVLLPELQQLVEGDVQRWERTLQILQQLAPSPFASALAALLREVYLAAAEQSVEQARHTVSEICRRWRLANDETAAAVWSLEHESLVRRASRLPWSQVQPMLIDRRIEPLLCYAEAVAQVLDGGTAEVEFCRQQLARPRDQLNPPPLVDGNDLKQLGIEPGPVYKRLLDQARRDQLDGKITTKQQAIELVERLWHADAER